MKIPEPIIEPTTIIVESNRPSPLTSSASELTSRGRDRLRLLCHWAFAPSRARRKHALCDCQIFARLLGRIGCRQPDRESRQRNRLPRANTSAAIPVVIPPIATSGLLVNWRAARRNSSPTTGSGFSFVPVGKIGPTAI